MAWSEVNAEIIYDFQAVSINQYEQGYQCKHQDDFGIPLYNLVPVMAARIFVFPLVSH